jgi:hypothetical protein
MGLLLQDPATLGWHLEIEKPEERFKNSCVMSMLKGMKYEFRQTS